MRKAVVRTLQSERLRRSVNEGHAQFSVAWELYMGTELAQRKLSDAPETIRRYKGSMAKAAASLDGKKRIKKNDINGWINEEIKAGWTAGYINTLLRNVRACLALVAKEEKENSGIYGIYSELLDQIKGATPVIEPPLEPRCPPSDFLLRVLPAARNDGEEHFMVILGRTALRQGEARGLTPASFFPRQGDHGYLKVTRQRDSRSRKNKIPHEIILDADLEARVRWLMQPAHRASLASGHRNGNPNGFLFPWTDHYMEKFVGRLCEHLGEEANLYFPEGCSWHAFRHHAAAECVRHGGTTDDVQRLLGDKSPAAAQMYMDTLRGVKKARPIPPIAGFDLSQKSKK